MPRSVFAAMSLSAFILRFSIFDSRFSSANLDNHCRFPIANCRMPISPVQFSFESANQKHAFPKPSNRQSTIDNVLTLNAKWWSNWFFKPDLAGSTPASVTTLLRANAEGTTSLECACRFITLSLSLMLAVAEWLKARDCESRFRGFESRPSTQNPKSEIRNPKCFTVL